MGSKQKADWPIGKKVIHRAVLQRYAKDGPVIEDREVVLLAVSGIWAMVRRPRAMPYVAEVKDLDLSAAVARKGGTR